MKKQAEQDINLQAMERMSQLNGQLVQYGYTGRERETLLVRLLLCFFSNDTGVFPKDGFFRYLEAGRSDGSDLPARLNRLFRALAGTSPETGGELEEFPIISSSLFAEAVEEREMDAFFWLLLLGCRDINWREISPAIFGAMFQEIMNQQDRKEWGAYYTSEENISRVIGPLFLDELIQERKACRGNKRRLRAFQQKLAGLHFLDPACGCGNFLILTYRKLRELELDVIQELYDTSQRVLDVSMYCKVSVSQFFGIEIEPFQAQIARTCLWLTERQMNLAAAECFGISRVYHSLIQPVGIRVDNALSVDWGEVVNPGKLDYIIGNPPFVGARLMNASQKQDMKMVFGGFHAVGNMDYVTGWYRKAAEFIMGTKIRCAFVSTNSICQGEQAALLWKELSDVFHMSIDFAWRSFVWNNKVKGQAKVHCIIVGFSDASLNCRGEQYLNGKRIFDGDRMKVVPHINAYLTAGPDVAVTSRKTPICDVPNMVFGSMANDDGNLILTPGEREELLAEYPGMRSCVRPFLGSVEFINGKERYCLWLADADPEEYLKIPQVAARIRRVQEFRSRSRREATRKLALKPELFGEIRQPESGHYILVPRVSSMRRRYIPMGFVPASWVASDAVLIIPGADEAMLSILSSSLHMVWVNAIAGRLKSDYRYSASVVYNNFPFPELDEEQRERLRLMGKGILDVRSSFAGASLASLYDKDAMPGELAEVHRLSDRLVEEIYGCAGCSEEEKLTLLLERFQSMTGRG